MIYSVSDDTPESWMGIIDSFMVAVDHDVEFNKGVPIDNISCFVKHGQLMINYSGGNKITDAFASFAREMSSHTCTECGKPATRLIFKFPICDECD